MSSPHTPTQLAVHVGFAGSRRLFDLDATESARRDDYERQVGEHLVARLGRLGAELSLDAGAFLCGISQVAVGADTLFSRALARLAWPQRVFLPQPPDEFLNAGSGSERDFTDAQRSEAQTLLSGANVAEVRVASRALERSARFEETNFEIVRASDVLVSLVREGASEGRGGTEDLRRKAQVHGIPMLSIVVAIRGGAPTFTERWSNLESFEAPRFPEPLQGRAIGSPQAPDLERMQGVIEDLTEELAAGKQAAFRSSALIIILAHILATVCAVVAISLPHESHSLPVFLAVELLVLATGFAVHSHLHHSCALETWAIARLLAEVNRSCKSLRGLHTPLHHLFGLELPTSLRPVLRTLNLLHLQDSRAQGRSLEEFRGDYLSERVDHQIAYYENQHARAAFRLSAARRTFLACSLFAFVATAVKLLGGLHLLNVGDGSFSFLGALAILLPVFAVGALSLSVAHDLEARKHTFSEMLAFLRRQRGPLSQAESEHELAVLVLETEARLVGETAYWYSRRSFTGVA